MHKTGVETEYRATFRRYDKLLDQELAGARLRRLLAMIERRMWKIEETLGAERAEQIRDEEIEKLGLEICENCGRQIEKK